MDKKSYLDAQQLNKVCDEYTKLFDKDINEWDSFYKEIIDALDELKSICVGDAIDAFAAYIETSIYSLREEAVKADECDLRDIQILKSKVTKTYDGKLICTSYETANQKRDEYRAKAENEKKLAASFNTTVIKTLPDGTTVTEHINNPHEHWAKVYQDRADGYQKEMEMWQTEMDEFDKIEAETAGLFTLGLAIRKEKFGVDIHDEFMKQLNINSQMLNGLGKTGVWDEIANLLKYLAPKDSNPLSVSVTNPGWLVDNAGTYGLTEIEARYIEEYYPTLANSMYGLSKTDHQGYIDNLTNDMKTKLKDDYFFMMEEYGYAYEAIVYLHENNPNLMSSLDAVRRFDSSSIDDVRMGIYKYLLDNDICVYDPVYSFDAYNIPSGASLTGNEVQFNTNCYAYAFGLTNDPRTGESLPFNGLQPGYFSGKEDEFYKDFDDIYSSDSSNDGSLLVEYIQADADALGLSFVPYEEGMTGGVKVALVIDPVNYPGDNPDYHWYYFDEESGTWFNKQGIQPATDSYLGSTEGQYQNGMDFSEDQGVFILTGSDGYLYPYIGNYGDIIGSDYFDHASSAGYEINVGEFYITRLDGGDFE